MAPAPSTTILGSFLVFVIIVFILFLIFAPCGSSSCGCSGSKASASGKAQQAQSGPGEEAGADDADDLPSVADHEEHASGAANAHGNAEAEGELVDLSHTEDSYGSTSQARSRINRAKRHLAKSLASGAGASGALSQNDFEVPSGAALDGDLSVEEILDLQRAADEGDEEASAVLEAHMTPVFNGEVASGASMGATASGHQRVTVPMTAEDQKRFDDAADITKRLGKDFYMGKDQVKSRRKRARFLENLAAENPDKATEIMRVAGAGMVSKPTNEGMKAAKARRRTRTMAAFDEVQEVDTGNSRIQRGKEGRRLPGVDSFSGREVPADYQRRTAMIRADDPQRLS